MTTLARFRRSHAGGCATGRADRQRGAGEGELAVADCTRIARLALIFRDNFRRIFIQQHSLLIDTPNAQLTRRFVAAKRRKNGRRAAAC